MSITWVGGPLAGSLTQIKEQGYNSASNSGTNRVTSGMLTYLGKMFMGSFNGEPGQV